MSATAISRDDAALLQPMMPARLRTARIEPDEPPRASASRGLTDEELACHGSAGIEELFRRHQAPLYRFCLGITAHAEEAADAMQVVWERALVTFSGDQAVLEVRPWLYTVARNECLDRIRARRSDRTVDMTDVDLPGGLTPEEQFERQCDLELLLGDLALLSERQRSALVMREFAGYDADELATALSTSPSRALGLVAEARRSLTHRRSGRALACSSVQHDLSRIRRRSGAMQAHLDSCADCRCFEHRRRGRKLSSLAIAPLFARTVAERLFAVFAGPAAGVAKTAAAAMLVAGSVGVVATNVGHDPKPPASRSATSRVADPGAAVPTDRTPRAAPRRAAGVRPATTPGQRRPPRATGRPRVPAVEPAPAATPPTPAPAAAADAAPRATVGPPPDALDTTVRDVTAVARSTTEHVVATVQGAVSVVKTVVDATPAAAPVRSIVDRALAIAQPAGAVE